MLLEKSYLIVILNHLKGIPMTNRQDGMLMKLPAFGISLKMGKR